MRTMASVVVVFAILLAATACFAQPANAPQAPAVPAHGATPAVPAAAATDEDIISSPWHDFVHYFGLINAGLATLAFLAGATLLVGFEVRGRPWKDPVRVKIRYAHMTLGLTAIGFGVAHYVGRSIQGGQFWWGLIPPTWAFIGFVILLITGILRYKTPWKSMQWLHRVGFVVALYYLQAHALYQYHKFVGGR